MSERRTATFSKVLNMTFWQVAYLILDNDLSPSINKTTKISKFQKTTNFILIMMFLLGGKTVFICFYYFLK